MSSTSRLWKASFDPFSLPFSVHSHLFLSCISPWSFNCVIIIVSKLPHYIIYYYYYCVSFISIHSPQAIYTLLPCNNKQSHPYYWMRLVKSATLISCLVVSCGNKGVHKQAYHSSTYTVDLLQLQCVDCRSPVRCCLGYWNSQHHPVLPWPDIIMATSVIARRLVGKSAVITGSTEGYVQCSSKIFVLSFPTLSSRHWAEIPNV